MKQESLSNRSLWLTRATSIGFAILGLTLFIAPAWATANFPWSISPFVAMTMGGWYLGNAYIAWEVARNWRWRVIYASLIFLWAFGLLQTALLVLHANVLRPDAILFPLYVAAVGLAAVNALSGIFDWLTAQPAFAPEGERPPLWTLFLTIGFILFVGYLAVPLLLGSARGGTVWPGTLTLLTARAFGAFYFSLVMGAIAAIMVRGLAPILFFVRTGLSLILAITIAAFVFIGEFDFASRPGGLVYFAAYAAGAVGALAMLFYRFWRSRQAVRQTLNKKESNYAR